MAERIHSFDTLKGLAILSVIFIHSREIFIGHGAIQNSLDFLLLNISRLAVPIFFLLSGYLLSTKIKEKGGQYTTKYIKYLSKYYLLGTGLFLILEISILSLNSILGWNIISSVITIDLVSLEGLFKFLYHGNNITKHLWFLTALVISAGIIDIFRRYRKVEEVFAIGLGLHVFAILSNSYNWINLFPVPRNDALFFGLVFTATGFLVKKRNLVEKSSRTYLKFIGIFGSLYFAERVFITFLTSADPFYLGVYSFTTLPLALSILMYAIANKDLAEDSRFNKYGKNSLWIYILHPIPIGVLVGIGKIIESQTGVNVTGNLIWSLLMTSSTYVVLMAALQDQRLRGIHGRLASYSRLNTIYKN